MPVCEVVFAQARKHYILVAIASSADLKRYSIEIVLSTELIVMSQVLNEPLWTLNVS
jgi:hypothetical protein